MMTVVHSAKLLVYLSLGFAFTEYWQLLVMMVIMATVGSWLGTRLRQRISMLWLKKMLPWLLTMLALRLIGGIVYQQFLAHQGLAPQ